MIAVTFGKHLPEEYRDHESPHELRRSGPAGHGSRHSREPGAPLARPAGAGQRANSVARDSRTTMILICPG